MTPTCFPRTCSLTRVSPWQKRQKIRPLHQIMIEQERIPTSTNRKKMFKTEIEGISIISLCMGLAQPPDAPSSSAAVVPPTPQPRPPGDVGKAQSSDRYDSVDWWRLDVHDLGFKPRLIRTPTTITLLLRWLSTTRTWLTSPRRLSYKQIENTSKNR